MKNNHTYLHSPARDPSPTDYRLAIAEAVGFRQKFENRLLTVDSNTPAAIYFTKGQVRQIARSLNVGGEVIWSATKPQLLQAVLQTLPDRGCPPVTPPTTHQNTRSYFREHELKQVCRKLELNPEEIDTQIITEVSQMHGSALAAQYLYDLLDVAYVDFYLSANTGSATAGSRIYYPYRMDPVHEIPDSASNAVDCHRYIVDSSFKDDTIGNRETIRTAIRVNASAVVLADVFHEPLETIDQLVAGVDLASSLDFEGTLVLPLQPPFDVSLSALQRSSLTPQNHIIALGGLANADSEADKIAAATTARDVLGDDVHLHGLGFGATETLGQALDENPHLLDSIDNSTPAQNSISNIPNGGAALDSVAAHINSKIVDQLRVLSPLVQTTGSQPTAAQNKQSTLDGPAGPLGK